MSATLSRNRESAVPATVVVDGVVRPAQNSLGQPIHPTQAGIENFWRWFGDSSVQDAEGKPLVMYHGTPMTFRVFNTFPIFFTNDAQAAGSYATGQYAPPEADSGPNVMPVYLNMQNPREIAAEELHSLIPAEEDDINSIEWSDFDNLATSFESEGYDGVIIRGVKDYAGGDGAGREWRAYVQYVVFNPGQIKSAIGNSGAFDPGSDTICDHRASPRHRPSDFISRLQSLDDRLAEHEGPSQSLASPGLG